jgi:TRAP-type C4-dicarboxylate transport system permease small subunit
VESDPVERVLRPIGWLLAALLMAMVAVTFAQVVQRYLLSSGITWAEEVARYCFVWIVFLGSAIALHRGMHVGVDLLTDLLPPPLKRAVAALSELLITGFCLAVIWASIPVLRVNAMQVSPALELQMSYVYAAIPIAMGLMALLSLLRLARILEGDEAAIRGQHGVEP